MSEIGTAFVSIVPSARGFGSQLSSQVGSETNGVGKRLGAGFGKVFAAAAALGVGAGIVSYVKTGVESLQRIERINTQTAAAIKSTGGAAGVTAKHVENLAGRLENMTATEAETTQEGSNLLLTFTNIRNEAGKGNKIFDQTVRTMTDMSRALGTDAKGSALQLGKALNDPIKGVTALQRVGVSFTEQQREQIKTLVESGNTLGAQKLILGELNKEFGGSAKAFAQTTEGQIELAKHAFGTLQETITAGLLPPLGKLAGATATALNGLAEKWPAIVASVKATVLPVFDQIAAFFGGGSGIQSGVSSLVASVQANFLPVLQTMATTFTTVVLPAVLNLANYLRDQLGPIFAQVGGIIASQVLPIVSSLEQFFYGRLYPALIQTVTAVAQKLKPAFEAIVQYVQTSVLPNVQKLLALFQKYQPEIEKVVLVVAKVTGKVLEFAAAIVSKTLPIALKFQAFLSGALVSALVAVVDAVATAIRKFAAFVEAVGDAGGAVVDFAKKVASKVGEVIDKMTALPGEIKAAVGDLSETLLQAGRDVIGGLIDGIEDKLNDLKGKLSGVGDFIKAHKGPPSYDLVMLRPAGRLIMSGLIDGIGDGLEPLGKKMAEVTQKVVDGLNAQADKVRGSIDSIKSAFDSLASSVSQAFAGDLFSATNVGDFIQQGLSSIGDLRAVKAALETLRGWGISSRFLAGLFSTGNTDLILSLASGTKGEAQAAASISAISGQLSSSLGKSVATDFYGKKLERQTGVLEDIRDDIRDLDRRLGKVINGAASNGQRRRRAA